MNSPPCQKQLSNGEPAGGPAPGGPEGVVGAIVKILKNDRDFVPLDVTANHNGFVFCVSQPPRKKGTVQVFKKDGNVSGTTSRIFTSR